MKVEYLPRKFNYCKNISWDLIVDKIAHEFNNKTSKFVVDKESLNPPTFVLHNNYLPGKLQTVYDKVRRKWKTKVMHIYTSLGANSVTFGRHCDEEDVLLVQSVGRMNYYVDGIGAIEFNTGDGIIIPAGVYHTPYVLEPRITLSFSW
tara:strand:- start:13 stop:456 length:444 start_codon:yes stop_codon:yes gene_type:complete